MYNITYRRVSYPYLKIIIYQYVSLFKGVKLIVEIKHIKISYLQQIMTTIIQDTWTGDDDMELYQYMDENNIAYQSLSGDEILKLDANTLDLLFCDTQIYQKMVSNYVPPDTYPVCFQKYYHRNIVKMKLSDCLHLEKPYFVKPATNNKVFNATIVKDEYDIAYLQSENSEDSDIYVSDVVNFVNEYRLFILNYELYGIVESSQYILDAEKIRSQNPPKEFVDEILKINPYKCVVIDIGLLDTGEWAVVEVNPPFSLSSYDLPIEKYYRYSQNVWYLALMNKL